MKIMNQLDTAKFSIAISSLLITIAFSICCVTKAYAVEDNMNINQTETIVLGGGCFWGVEAVFEHTKGVIEAVSGYAGGKEDTAHYTMVSDGDTGHAESVKVIYNPKQISLDALLDIYFKVAHNPTQLNYQGPDQGTQYRSVIFYASAEQEKQVDAKIAALDAKHLFSDPIVTKLEKLDQFYPAEEYHQNYAARHPMQPYIAFHDAPKVRRLKEIYPEFYKEQE